MAEQSEWQRQQRRSLLFKLLFFGLCAVIGFFIFRNNRTTDERAPIPPVDTVRAIATRQKAVTPEKSESTTTPLSIRKSIILPDIVCRLRENEHINIIVSLELYFHDDSLKKELMLKREDLSVIVQKCFYPKTLDTIRIQSLRRELITRLNAIVTGAAIVDVEFRNFKIEAAHS